MSKRPSRAKTIFKTLLHYRSFTIGLVIVAIFIGLTIYALITWPYDKAIEMWNDPSYWEDYPRRAPPTWIQVLTGRKEIDTGIILDTRDPRIARVVNRARYSRAGLQYEVVEIVIQFDYDVFPTGVSMKLIPVLEIRGENETGVSIVVDRVVWRKPNNVNITLFRGSIGSGETAIPTLIVDPLRPPLIYGDYVRVLRKLYNYNLTKILPSQQILFMNDERFVETGEIEVLKGKYVLEYEYIVKDVKSLEIRAVFYGTVYGLLGTDRFGRDLFMGVAWGTPIAMSFGLLASLISAMLTMVIAAFIAWYRSAVDITFSRINEIFMILPFLPTIVLLMFIMPYTIWLLLGVTILFSVIGSGALKTERALFYQVRESPYIEAARAYGASSLRIIFRYMIPRVIPIIIPSIITSVPSFVFLEAALAVLGISDPRTITWGKILEEAYSDAALIVGAMHWILAPATALFLMSVAFASIGFTLDRVFNPRLRQI